MKVFSSRLTLFRTFHVTNAGASLPSSRISTAVLFLPLETGMNTWILMQGIPHQCKLLVYRTVWSRVFSTKASIQGPASVVNFRYSNILDFLCFSELLSGNCSLCKLPNLPPHFQLCQSVPFGAFFFFQFVQILIWSPLGVNDFCHYLSDVMPGCWTWSSQGGISRVPALLQDRHTTCSILNQKPASLLAPLTL